VIGLQVLVVASTIVCPAFFHGVSHAFNSAETWKPHSMTVAVAAAWPTFCSPLCCPALVQSA